MLKSELGRIHFRERKIVLSYFYLSMIVNLEIKVLDSGEHTEIKTKMMTDRPPADLMFPLDGPGLFMHPKFPRWLF